MMASKRESTSSSSSVSNPSKKQKMIHMEYQHSASICYPAGTCFFPTPIYIRNKSCVVNVKNENDHLCFIYSILVCMKNPIFDGCNHVRLSTYKNFLDIFNYDAKNMPMKIDNIHQFEQCNPQVSINVIKYTPPLKFRRIKIVDESIKHPYFELIYRSMRKSEGGCQVIYLLLVENNEDGRYRYMAITNLKRMLTVTNGPKSYNNVCFSCLRLFQSMNKLEEHVSTCSNKDLV